MERSVTFSAVPYSGSQSSVRRFLVSFPVGCSPSLLVVMPSVIRSVLSLIRWVRITNTLSANYRCFRVLKHCGKAPSIGFFVNNRKMAAQIHLTEISVVGALPWCFKKTVISILGAQSEMKNILFLSCLLKFGIFSKHYQYNKLMAREKDWGKISYRIIYLFRQAFNF